METFNVITCDEAIKMIRKIKRKNTNCKIIVTSFNFDNGKTRRKSTTPDRICVLIENSNTVIFNKDDFVPHIQLYSKKQIPKNIIREGIMHDVLLIKI